MSINCYVSCFSIVLLRIKLEGPDKKSSGTLKLGALALARVPALAPD